MTEPRTKAGKALLALQATAERGQLTALFRVTEADILAIEAEAAALVPSDAARAAFVMAGQAHPDGYNEPPDSPATGEGRWKAAAKRYRGMYRRGMQNYERLRTAMIGAGVSVMAPSFDGRPDRVVIEVPRPSSPATGEGLADAWAATEAAIPDGTRLVLWQHKGGPRYLQVLAPSGPDCEHDDDTMKPIATRLADYPSKGLGDLLAAFRSIATDPRLAATTPDGLRTALERLAPERPISVPGPNGTDRCRDCWARVPGEYESFVAEHRPGCAWVTARAALAATTPDTEEPLPLHAAADMLVKAADLADDGMHFVPSERVLVRQIAARLSEDS